MGAAKATGRFQLAETLAEKTCVTLSGDIYYGIYHAGEDWVDGDFKKASLFMNGRSQAVRLPKEFRFEGTHVYARKEGNRVILTPIDDRWERFLAAFGSAPDFPDRDEPPMQDRPELDAWADASD